MELRHLRYFVAVAEEGSLTVAAEKRLHTAQPSLSRQIRDLEYELGIQLLTRSVRGIELTAAGKVFLDHARLALDQVVGDQSADLGGRPHCRSGRGRQHVEHIADSHTVSFADRRPSRAESSAADKSALSAPGAAERNRDVKRDQKDAQDEGGSKRHTLTPIS
jgi:hypothetical protein